MFFIKLTEAVEIKEIYYVKRDEPFSRMSENADSSPEIIKNSIKEGEEKTNEIIKIGGYLIKKSYNVKILFFLT